MKFFAQVKKEYRVRNMNKLTTLPKVLVEDLQKEKKTCLTKIKHCYLIKAKIVPLSPRII